MGITLGSGTNLGGGSILGDGGRWGTVSTLGGCADRRIGLVWIGIRGGISAAMSGLHAPKRSRSLAMASSWLWCAVAGAYWMKKERKCRA